MPRVFTLLSVLLFAAVASAQDWAKAKLEKSPRHQEWVKLEHDGRAVEAFIVYPEVKNPATSVVVIHEIFGLSDWARSVCDTLAEAGYVAIAPDMLSGAGPNGGGTASLGGNDGVGRAIRNLPSEQITKDLSSAVDYLQTLPAANGKVAVMGFCWGGGQAFQFAANDSKIKASLVFYGLAPGKEEELARITCPVFGFYGENDARITVGVPTTKELMDKLQKKYDPVTYDGAGHGFFRGGEQPSPREADAKARGKAWERVQGILKNL